MGWGVNRQSGKSVHELGQEAYGNCISQSLWYEPETAPKKYLLKVDSEDKIKNRMVPGFKISILHDKTRIASLQRHLELQDFSMQSTKTNLWRVAGFFPVWFPVHRTWTTGILHPVQGELFFLFVKIEWNHVSNKELYKLSNTNINCYWITYKCDVAIFQMCESWL